MQRSFCFAIMAGERIERGT